ncbi:LCP family protein [Streptomyces marincola]|nr:LCP family protein [Streptomyces marincola]
MAVQMTRNQKWLWWSLLAFGILLAITAGTALWAYQRLNGNIRTDHTAAEALARDSAGRPAEERAGARNILVIGHDEGSGTGNARSDTVLLLHLAADGSRVDAVHVPRDIVVDIPACAEPGGGRSRPGPGQFNWAFQYGGAACTIRTFEQLSGVRVDHHLTVGFEGFAEVVDAVGGVEVELAEAERDPNVGHDLPAGRHVLDGEQALAYARARVHVGDGSDLNRLLRQQHLLGLLHERITEDGAVGNPARLYPLLTAATSAITADAGLDSLNELHGLVRDVRAVPDDAVTFRTVPTLPHPAQADRLALDTRAADRLFAALRRDERLPSPV